MNCKNSLNLVMKLEEVKEVRLNFFLQSQGQQQFTAYIDKLRNIAFEADLSNATAEDLIVVMGIVGCKDDELRGDLQKLEAPKLADIIKLREESFC